MVGVARAIFPAKIRPGAGLQGIEVREQRLLQGPRTPEAHGVLVQPECLEPTSRAQRLLQPEELELRRPVGPLSLATVASRA